GNEEREAGRRSRGGSPRAGRRLWWNLVTVIAPQVLLWKTADQGFHGAVDSRGKGLRIALQGLGQAQVVDAPTLAPGQAFTRREDNGHPCLQGQFAGQGHGVGLLVEE